MDGRQRQSFGWKFGQNPVAPKLDSESVVQIEGKVRLRPDGTENPKIPTGKIEVIVDKFWLLNDAAPLPFQIDDPEIAGKVNEELRLQYRYLGFAPPGNGAQSEAAQQGAIATRVFMD